MVHYITNFMLGIHCGIIESELDMSEYFRCESDAL